MVLHDHLGKQFYLIPYLFYKNKMQITNLTLAYQLLELRPLLEDAFVNNVQEISKEIYKFKLHTKEGTQSLIVNPSVLYLSQYKIPAKQNVYGFAAFLKKHLSNKKILSVEQHNFDRVVLLEFLDYFLILEFLKESNIILTDKKYKILRPLKRQHWKDRLVKKGEEYRFPPPKGVNPAEISFKELEACFRNSNLDAIRALVNSVNVAPVLGEEILYRLKIDKGAKAKEIQAADLKRIYALMKKFYSKISLKDLKPVKTKGFILPFGLDSLQEPQEKVVSLNDALDDIYSRDFLGKEIEEELAEKESEIAKLQYSLGQQLEVREKFVKQVEQNKQKAELIYKNFNELQELVGAIKRAEQKRLDRKEIMYKLENAAKKGSKAARLLKEYNPKNKEIVVELNYIKGHK